MSKNILVAGGAGFIGSHLCKELLKQKHSVFCVDNLLTGQLSNIKDLQKNSNFEFIKGNILDPKTIKKISAYKFKQIYHLASPASLIFITKYQADTALVNSIGTKNLLDLAVKNKAKFLFTSSSEVYGDPLKHPQKENYWGNVNPVGPRSSYDESKRFGEALCIAYRNEFGVETRIVRLFNTYGPNSNKNDSRIVPSFINQALNNNNITVHGTGTQTRSFCYVTDTVAGIIKTMESSDTMPFNIGNSAEYKIIDVAKLILKLTDSKSKIIYTPRPVDDPSLRKPDVTKAIKILKWKPKIDFTQGLKETIKYFKNND